jgi:hypothetical protein
MLLLNDESCSTYCTVVTKQIITLLLFLNKARSYFLITRGFWLRYAHLSFYFLGPCITQNAINAAPLGENNDILRNPEKILVWEKLCKKFYSFS